jgi:hypothetical protein
VEKVLATRAGATGEKASTAAADTSTTDAH